MNEKKTVVIAEDHTILREGLKSMINAGGDLEVVGEAEDGLKAIRLVNKKMPDVVLLDLSMPKMGGLSVIKEVAGSYPEIKIVVLTMHAEEEYALEAFKSGAHGYCLKSSSHKELRFAIKSVLEGYLESRKRLKEKTSWETLTQREIEVLKLVGEGYRNKEIADFLCISIKTVEKHRANIMRKLDLHNASALTVYAVEKGLVVK